MITQSIKAAVVVFSLVGAMPAMAAPTAIAVESTAQTETVAKQEDSTLLKHHKKSSGQTIINPRCRRYCSGSGSQAGGSLSGN